MRLNWYKVGFWVAAFGAWVIIFFTVSGIYQWRCGIPEKKAQIAELTRARDAWKKQAMDQDRYIQQQRKHIANLQSAMNFENLLVYAASPQGLIDMKEIENMLKNKAEFCLSGGEDERD